jgi:hypothetical protein
MSPLRGFPIFNLSSYNKGHPFGVAILFNTEVDLKQGSLINDSHKF